MMITITNHDKSIGVIWTQILKKFYHYLLTGWYNFWLSNLDHQDTFFSLVYDFNILIKLLCLPEMGFFEYIYYRGRSMEPKDEEKVKKNFNSKTSYRLLKMFKIVRQECPNGL